MTPNDGATPAMPPAPASFGPDRAGAPRGSRLDRVGLAVLSAITLLFLVILGRVAQLQVAPSAALREHVEQRLSVLSEPAPRGDLRDRRGRILSATRLGYRVFVDPTLLRPPFGDTFRALAGVTGLDASEIGERIAEKLRENERRAQRNLARPESEHEHPIRYVSIGGVLSDAQLEAAQRLAIPGVALEPRPVRELAIDEPTLAPLIGVVGIDHDGLLGAERTFEPLMKARDGALRYVRDSRGEALWFPSGAYTPPQRGEDIRLSIDVVLQQIAAEELAKGVERADAAGGRLLMVDPTTGEILAMVDHIRDVPGLAPWRKGAHPEQAEGRRVRYRTILGSEKIAEIPAAMRRNRCVEDVYEPGSTFKPFIWSVLTERGYCKPGEVFNTHNGQWRTEFGRFIGDVTPRETCTWREVLIYSSNIGMVQGAARQPYAQTRKDVLRFGFGAKTGIGLPGESSGIVTSAKNWSKYTQSSIPSGYEIAVTPMQMVRAFSVFAREGDLMGTIPALRLTAATPEDVEHELRRRVLPPWVVEEAREAMKQVAENMETRTRQYFRDDAPCTYSMFGKSGTAEIPRPGGGGYFDGQYNSSFLVAAPAERPRIVVLAIIDDPGPELIAKRMHYGSAVAGPVVRQVIRRALNYLGVPEPPAPESREPEQLAAHDPAAADDE